MKKPPYTLIAEPAPYEICGAPTSGILGATYTGRSIDIEGRYPEAKEWRDNYETSGEERPELEYLVLQSLRPAAAHTFEAPLFRGRRLNSPPDSSERFGPPKPEQASQGRYNTEGIPVLYLCPSVNGVKRELGTPQPGGNLWTQRFRLLPELRMADARPGIAPALDPFAAAVFWVIESGRDHARRPLLGQRIGQLIAAEYDGLIVPGVRGQPDELYWNAVVFRPEKWWLRLIDRSAQPEEAS